MFAKFLIIAVAYMHTYYKRRVSRFPNLLDVESRVRRQPPSNIQLSLDWPVSPPQGFAFHF